MITKTQKEMEHVWLHKIRLPHYARGEGTKRLAGILSIIDDYHMDVCLTADPIFQEEDEEPEFRNPKTYHLVKWYNRFGFIPYGPTEDGFSMARPAMKKQTVDQILKNYQEIKEHHDLNYDEFIRKWCLPKFKKFT